MLRNLSEEGDIARRKFIRYDIDATKAHFQVGKHTSIASDKFWNHVGGNELSAAISQLRTDVEIAASQIHHIGRIGKFREESADRLDVWTDDVLIMTPLT